MTPRSIGAPASGAERRGLGSLGHDKQLTSLTALLATAAFLVVAVAALAAPEPHNTGAELAGRSVPGCVSSQVVDGASVRSSKLPVCGESGPPPRTLLSRDGLVTLLVLLCLAATAPACLWRSRARRRAAQQPAAAVLLAEDQPSQGMSSADAVVPEAADAAGAAEPSSPLSSETDSPRPLRSALRRTSAVLEAARAHEAAARAAVAPRLSVDNGLMSPFDAWLQKQGLAGRAVAFTLFTSADKANGSATAQVVLQDKLGGGRYGEVLAASWERRGEVVAKALTAPHTRLVAADVARIAALRHPNVLRVLGFATLPEASLLLLRRSACGSLVTLLRADADADAAARLGWPRRAALAAGVASGLAFLHAQKPPFAHGDVKCENVMLDDDLTPRLSDAGLLACRPDGAFACGTPLYAPPEIAEGASLPADALAADMYAFGSAVLHLLAHAGVASADSFSSPLYRAIYAAFEASAPDEAASVKWDSLQVQFARSQAGWLPEVAPGCPAAMAAAIASCCIATPAVRPSAEAMRLQSAAWAASAHEW